VCFGGLCVLDRVSLGLVLDGGYAPCWSVPMLMFDTPVSKSGALPLFALRRQTGFFYSSFAFFADDGQFLGKYD